MNQGAILGALDFSLTFLSPFQGLVVSLLSAGGLRLGLYSCAAPRLIPCGAKLSKKTYGIDRELPCDVYCPSEELMVPTAQLQVQRFSVISSKPFDQVMAGIDVALGHPDMKDFWKDAQVAKTYPELENVIQKLLGPSGLMEFVRYDHGGIVGKGSGKKAPKIVRLVAGNPLIMKKMVEHVPDAGSYAPVTILIDERADGVHLSYDRMASFLASYGNAEALKVAQDLDSKVEKLLTTVAS